MRKRDRRMHRFGEALAHGNAVKIAIGHLVDKLRERLEDVALGVAKVDDQGHPAR